MTCIVGVVEEDGRIVIGGDSAGVSGYDLRARADAKVFRVGGFLIGFTSSFRMGQLLRWKLSTHLQAQPADMADDEFMCTLFVDAIRKCLSEGGYARKESEAETGGEFVVGYRAALWHVHSDYQVAQLVDRFTACGCGEGYAHGALAVLTGDAESRVRRALETAERFSAGVRGPFVVMAMESCEASRRAA